MCQNPQTEEWTQEDKFSKSSTTVTCVQYVEHMFMNMYYIPPRAFTDSSGHIIISALFCLSCILYMYVPSSTGNQERSQGTPANRECNTHVFALRCELLGSSYLVKTGHVKE